MFKERNIPCTSASRIESQPSRQIAEIEQIQNQLQKLHNVSKLSKLFKTTVPVSGKNQCEVLSQQQSLTDILLCIKLQKNRKYKHYTIKRE